MTSSSHVTYIKRIFRHITMYPFDCLEVADGAGLKRSKKGPSNCRSFFVIHKQFVDESIQIVVPNLRRATTASKTGLHTLQLTTKIRHLGRYIFEPAVLVSGWPVALPSRDARSRAPLRFGFRQSEWHAFVEFIR